MTSFPAPHAPQALHLGVLEAARVGDQQAWARIYDALAGPLLSYLRHLGAGGDSEDLLGETFVQIARDLPRFSGEPAELRP